MGSGDVVPVRLCTTVAGSRSLPLCLKAPGPFAAEASESAAFEPVPDAMPAVATVGDASDARADPAGSAEVVPVRLCTTAAGSRSLPLCLKASGPFAAETSESAAFEPEPDATPGPAMAPDEPAPDAVPAVATVGDARAARADPAMGPVASEPPVPAAAGARRDPGDAGGEGMGACSTAAAHAPSLRDIFSSRARYHERANAYPSESESEG